MKEENSILEIFEEALFRQTIDFPTCSQNILHVAFYRNCCFFGKRSILSHSIRLHKPRGSHTTLECPVTESKPALQKFWKCGLRRHQQLSCSQSIPTNLSQEHEQNVRRTLPASRSNDRGLCPKTDTAQTMSSTVDYQPHI